MLEVRIKRFAHTHRPADETPAAACARPLPVDDFLVNERDDRQNITQPFALPKQLQWFSLLALICAVSSRKRVDIQDYFVLIQNFHID